jgi:CheY-like chemotaxis protein
MKLSESKACILIADDDDDDQLMMTAAFTDTGFKGVINTVNNGEQLLDYLHKRGSFIDSPMPKLILLDLNMPKKDGREVLKELRRFPKLSRVPVIVYSTSNNPDDIAYCYELGANSFISKPSSYDDLKKIAEVVQKYWLDIVLIPAPPVL